ncbi:Acetamidase [Aspergillus sp. HF37]|nr:Acetamidase [Aspergillus sp. HF37]
MMGSTNGTWESIAKAKRQSLAAAIPAEWVIPAEILPPAIQTDVTTFPSRSGWFTKRELAIMSTDAAEILRRLSTGACTSEEVTRTNCLAEIFFDEAIARAKECDAYLQTYGKTKGLFHGLPISIKDNFNIVGKDSTIGMTSLANKPATYNSTLIDIIVDAGAVLYVKTNVPTAVMLPETVNNVFGRTLNPLNRKLTPGGSSGGESALLAFGGSRIGVGSDIGGSLRIPAACTGTFTLRPSAGRFPHCRARSGLTGQEAVMSVNGPMAKTLKEIALYSKAIIDQQPWYQDPKCLPIPWRAVEPKKHLKLAVLWHDGIVTPTPPVARALRETVQRLRAAGHEIVEWDPEEHKQILTLLRRLFVADGAKSIRGLLEPTNEPFRPEMPSYEESVELGVHEMWQIQAERSDLQKRYLDRWNAMGGIDALICPTTPYSSVEHGKFTYAGYTGVYNLLDYSAISFPCGVNVDAKVDAAYKGYYHPLSEVDAQVQGDYDATMVDRLPVSLQLVARRLEEEKVLMMTDVVLRSLQGSGITSTMSVRSNI